MCTRLKSRTLGGVKFVGKLAEFAHRGVEGGGDLLEGVPRGIGLAALDQGEGGGRDVGGAGYGLLGCTALLAELTDGLAEGGLRSG